MNGNGNQFELVDGLSFRVIELSRVNYSIHRLTHSASSSAVPNLVATPPSSITVQENDDVVITCKATGYPVPQITWFSGMKQVNRRMYNTENGTLTIREIKFSERGSYRCEARNFVGIAKFTTTITVEGKIII